jgi:hypothetical protein
MTRTIARLAWIARVRLDDVHDDVVHLLGPGVQ